jgi:hypothetical protein
MGVPLFSGYFGQQWFKVQPSASLIFIPRGVTPLGGA